MRAAVELAFLTAKMDQALPVSPASVHALARPGLNEYPHQYDDFK